MVSDEEMVVSYLKEHKRAQAFTRASSLPKGQVQGFKDRGCQVSQDPSSGTYTISSPVPFGNLLTEAERKKARKDLFDFPLGCVGTVGFRGGGAVFGMPFGSLATVLWGISGFLLSCCLIRDEEEGYFGGIRRSVLFLWGIMFLCGGVLAGPVLRIWPMFPIR